MQVLVRRLSGSVIFLLPKCFLCEPIYQICKPNDEKPAWPGKITVATRGLHRTG
jgi:hypothetical protein